ncbi:MULTISPECIES: DUF2790 domain-containing protein [unclassified Pseudomonas]|jgi:hypothetical protein|uniref:DUF2790 domain-containing protein n=1 Tax=unclassified Pseudomonas TaxID=196821 RepID=UPI000C2FB29A|nr:MULTISPECIES: DUF2790 domain-containing protein [unclassified Pseudomonas]MBV6754446.1 DUF2790 domain-containing protein [Pseudomonas chlororaphis]MCU1740547.1 DUF2790 domain-containing protein [Pseudomonas sp. 20S_6.2_Bac1]
MKYLLFVLLSLFSLVATAQGDATAAPQGQGATASANAEPYDYSEDLDMAKAVRADSAAASDCGPVQGHVIYVDGQGVRHEMNFIRLGNACQHG